MVNPSPFRFTLVLTLVGTLALSQVPAPVPAAGQPPATQPPATQPAAPATTPATAPAASAPPAVTVPGALNLTNASLLEVIDLLARDLHINYILDSRVKSGTVTINTYGEIKAVDLRPLLETILRMNQLAMVQVGNIYRIVPVGEVSRLPISPQVNQKDLPDDERMFLNLIFLKYMTASEMEGILKPFVGESATIVSYPPANLLMIEDNSRNMKRTIELINIFDSDQFAGQRVQLFRTQNSRPSDLVKELDTIFKAYALNEKTAAVKFLPIDRINTVLSVASNPGVFKEVESWIKKLDVPVRLPAGAVSNHVYRLKYGRAEVIGDVIQQLYGGGGGGSRTGGYGGFSQAGQRFNGTGYPSGGGAFGNSSLLGGSAMMGGNFGMGGNLANNGLTAGAVVDANQAPGALSSAFGPAGTQPAGTATTGAAGTPTTGAPGTSRDLTGSYLGASPAMMGYLPRIIPNPYDNTLLVQGTPQQWEQILDLLEQMDVAPRQVLIDAKIYEVELSGAFASGVQAYLQQKGSTSPLGAVREVLGSTAGGLNLTAGLLVGHSRQLMAVLTSSETNSKARIISAPSIIATDSIPASINVGSDIPTLSAQAVGGIQSGGNSVFTQAITNVSTGVSLNILARVNASGIVTMVIDQSVSAPSQNTTSGIDSPSFSKRNVSTQVTVQDGDLIAIGGIIQENSSEGTSGVPFLHRLPIVGAAFGSRSYSKQRTELIIFLTPRVIYDTNQVADATEELKNKVKKLTKMIRE